MLNVFTIWVILLVVHILIVQSNPVCNMCVWKHCTPKEVGVPNFDVEDTTETFIRFVSRSTRKERADKLNNIISMLTSLSELQRLELDKQIRSRRGKSMVGVLGLLGLPNTWFRRLVMSFATPLPVYLAETLRTAIKKQDRTTVLEIYTTFPGCLISDVNDVYKQWGDPKQEIADAFTDDIHLQKDKTLTLYRPSALIELMTSLTEGLRESCVEVRQPAAKEKAEQMTKDMDGFKTGLSIEEKKWEQTFKEVFMKTSMPQLKEIITQYDGLRKNVNSFEKDIEQVHGSSKIFYRFIANVVRRQHEYFAEELNLVFKTRIKLPKHFRRLIYIIRSRYNIDMKTIIDSYYDLYHVRLKEDILHSRIIVFGINSFKSLLSKLSTA